MLTPVAPDATASRRRKGYRQQLHAIAGTFIGGGMYGNMVNDVLWSTTIILSVLFSSGMVLPVLSYLSTTWCVFPACSPVYVSIHYRRVEVNGRVVAWWRRCLLTTDIDALPTARCLPHPLWRRCLRVLTAPTPRTAASRTPHRCGLQRAFPTQTRIRAFYHVCGASPHTTPPHAHPGGNRTRTHCTHYRQPRAQHTTHAYTYR